MMANPKQLHSQMMMPNPNQRLHLQAIVHPEQLHLQAVATYLQQQQQQLHLHLQVMVNPKQHLCLQVMAKNLHLQLQAERGKAPPPDQCHCNSSRASHVVQTWKCRRYMKMAARELSCALQLLLLQVH
jgi:hypothetical protein